MIYRDVDGDGAEFRRALAGVCAGWRPPGALLFRGGAEVWPRFYADRFASGVAPHLVACYQAAMGGDHERLGALDSGFAGTLSKPERGRCEAAAAAVFAAGAGAQQLRVLERLRRARPGCTFPTAFAAHAAAFHVPLMHAIVSYLAVEWRAGMQAAGLEIPDGWEDVFAGHLLASPVSIREVFASSLDGSWADVA